MSFICAALCSGDPAAKPVSKGWRSQVCTSAASPALSLPSCTGALAILPVYLLEGFTTTPTRLWHLLPALTCPCGGDDFGLAAGTISFGGVGSDGDGIGGFWQQASNHCLLGGREEANEKSKYLLLE